jgi:hypothetical protein
MEDRWRGLSSSATAANCKYNTSMTNQGARFLKEMKKSENSSRSRAIKKT